jgi:hypothetical protein
MMDFSGTRNKAHKHCIKELLMPIARLAILAAALNLLGISGMSAQETQNSFLPPHRDCTVHLQDRNLLLIMEGEYSRKAAGYLKDNEVVTGFCVDEYGWVHIRQQGGEAGRASSRFLYGMDGGLCVRKACDSRTDAPEGPELPFRGR